MRRYNINSDWKFTKGEGGSSKRVNLPHVWDVRLGQNGGGGYVGSCTYEKQIALSNEWEGRDIYLEIGAANSVAEVLVNGRKAGIHQGGYSLFRVRLTEFLKLEAENRIEIRVDNTVRDVVYPILADYTLFGGIYRDVNLIVADRIRFSLDDDGSDSVYVRTEIEGERGRVLVSSVVDEPEGCEIVYHVFDQEGKLCAKTTALAGSEITTLTVEQPDLWNGRGSGYLYLLTADLQKQGKWLEKRSVNFGFRKISLTADTGFLLNGQHLLLRGVGRHQDREDRGFAVTREDMEEDMNLIKEIGANSVRLSNYQHDPYFYELCDREGLVVWTEIPFCSRLSGKPEAAANAKQQLKELIKQNFNHPSICFWGIGNDLTMFGETGWLEDAMRELNKLAKSLDPGRITVCSQMVSLKEDSPYNMVTDGVGYHVYYGWDSGTCHDMDQWITSIEKKKGRVPIAISEYGAAGILNYQTRSPTRGDYSESYQSVYHEQMLEIIRSHDSLWASYVWNMFDFAAVHSREGGVRGRNNKGLVTYDRRIRKDAFYLYQAEWSGKPVVHIVGKRYKRRAESRTMIRVYSNAEEVELFVNSHSLGAMCKNHHVFWLGDVELLPGRNDIMVRTERGDYDDVILYGEGTDEPSYLFKQDESMEQSDYDDGYCMKNGYFSVYDTLDEVMGNPEARQVMEEEVGKALLSHQMFSLIGSQPLESIARKSGGLIQVEWVRRLNGRLIKIRKTR